MSIYELTQHRVVNTLCLGTFNKDIKIYIKNKKLDTFFVIHINICHGCYHRSV